MISRLKETSIAALLGAILCLTTSVVPAQEVGAVAAVEPPAEIGRAGNWFPADLGTTIQQGDTLRTGQSGRLRVILADESVLSLAAGSELLLDQTVYDANGGRIRSVLELVRGKVRALVNENVNGGFDLGTPTAVSGVRGTDFITVYDEAAARTEVVGVTGAVGVRGKLGVVAPEVTVRAQHITRIERGKLPTKPEKLDDDLFRQYLDGFEFIGLGRAESLAFGQPLLGGDEVPSDDRLGVPQPAVSGAEPFEQLPPDNPFDVPDVSTLVGQPPAAVSGGPGELGIRF
jgi:hypothetical protein